MYTRYTSVLTEMYTVHCTLYSVQCLLYSVHCTLQKKLHLKCSFKNVLFFANLVLNCNMYQICKSKVITIKTFVQHYLIYVLYSTVLLFRSTVVWRKKRKNSVLVILFYSSKVSLFEVRL